MTMPHDGRPLYWRTGSPAPRLPAKSFLPLLRAAVAAHPGRTDLRRDLAIALGDDRRWQEVLDLLSPLAEADRLTPALACELARAAIACGRPAAALAALDAASGEAAPGGLGRRVLALYALDRVDEARAAVVQALAANPGDGAVLDAFADDCLRRGAAEALAAVCRRGIEGGACTGKYLTHLAAALALAGRRAELSELFDLSPLCSRVELAAGQVDDEELAEAILGHPSLAPSPALRPTRGPNLRLAGLAGIEHPAVRGLLAVVRGCVDAYLAERRDSPHPLLARRPQAAWLQGWALVVSDDGHEETHIHPQGWLTVVYYVRVPRDASPTAERVAPPPGSIVFEPWPPSVRDSLPDLPIEPVAPRAGTLLIFPSFLGHRTLPTGVGEARICAALDVIPLASAARTRPDSKTGLPA